MPRSPTYQAEQTVIRKLLQELDFVVVLRNHPTPSVFLNSESSARFHAATWPEVYDLVLKHYNEFVRARTVL